MLSCDTGGDKGDARGMTGCRVSVAGGATLSSKLNVKGGVQKC